MIFGYILQNDLKYAGVLTLYGFIAYVVFFSIGFANLTSVLQLKRYRSVIRKCPSVTILLLIALVSHVCKSHDGSAVVSVNKPHNTY